MKSSRGEMTSGYTPPKGDPDPDEILATLRAMSDIAPPRASPLYYDFPFPILKLDPYRKECSWDHCPSFGLIGAW